MPQIPAAIPTQAFELIRNRIAEILVDELPSQATFAGDPKLNATVYVERSVMFDLTEMPAVNVSVSRTAYSEQTQRNTDGEHTFTIDVHTSAKSTSSVRGDSLAAFRLQKLLGVCRGILEDSRYKTLGFAPPFIESRKVTSIEYAQPTDGDGTSSVQGRITFVVRAPDRNGVITPDLIAGYDTQVKLGLTEKGYIFTGDNIPVPPIVGAEISVNGTFYIDAEAGDEVDIPVLNSEGDAVGTVTPSVGVEVPDATYTLIDTDVPPNTLDSGSIAAGAAETIVSPATTVTVNTAPFGTAPSGGALNVPVVNGGANPVGSKQGGDWVIANNATFINGTQVTDQEAEVDANIFVTLDGAQSGSWNAGLQTWEVTSAAPTISVAVSNDNPQVGASITITATPTGFTPTNYLFFAKQNGSIEYIGQNALGVIAWTVNVFGTFDIYVQADNNVAASAFNIGGESVTSFVTITANILYVNASDPNSYSGSGTAWNDISVSNNDVTLVNGVTWDGQSMLFNGTNQYAEAPDSASLDIVGAISITVWIKSTDATDGGIISKSDNANKYFGGSVHKSYEIGKFGGQIYMLISNGVGTNGIVLSVGQTSSIYNGAWNSITFTWDGTTAANGIKYYLNGVLTAQATASITSIQSLASTLNIMGAGSYFTQGRIGAVLLSNSALSLAQITANYNSLRAIFP